MNAKTLLVAFNERGRAIDALLGNIASFSAQVQGLINDNPNLNHVLEQLRTVSDVLIERKEDLAKGLEMVGAFLPSLNESIASGPFFKVVIHNLVPGQILQPFIDAAFKKRGLSPEDFWRSAGLPEYRFPDPNGTRFPNGAPPRDLGCSKVPRTTRFPRCHPDRPARTRRPPTRCPGRTTRCPARACWKVRSVGSASRLRWTVSSRHRRIRTACRRRRVFRSPGGRANPRRMLPVPRCRCRRMRRQVPAPSRSDRPGRRHPRQRSLPGCRRVRPHRLGPGRSCPTRTSPQVAREVVVRREVARIEHHL